MTNQFVLFYESKDGNHDHFCFFSNGDIRSDDTRVETEKSWQIIGWKPNCYSIHELGAGYHVDYFRAGHEIPKLDWMRK